jgi:hypothetical protein
MPRKIKKVFRVKVSPGSHRKCFDDTKCDIAAALVSELKKSRETRRRMLMK